VIPRRAAAVLVLGALALVLVGCTDSEPAPASFLDRPELASCGRAVLEQGEGIPDDAAGCLESSVTSGAELVVEGPTTEGDPYVTYYRVGPEIEGIEIFIDSTLDRFGFGWAHQLCPDATSLLDLGECHQVD
jgi:hypothetical protein